MQSTEMDVKEYGFEDSYGTAGSFKTGGAIRFHSDPSGKEVQAYGRVSRLYTFIDQKLFQS